MARRKSAAARIRQYFLKRPKASPAAAAASLKVDIQHVYTTRYLDKRKAKEEALAEAEYNLGRLEDTVVDYINRWKDEGEVENLLKARHCLNQLIRITT